MVCFSFQSPVFLLFLDCVWQMLRQFPSSFQFTEIYLVSLWDSLCLGLFRNFKFNNARDCQYSAEEAPSGPGDVRRPSEHDAVPVRLELETAILEGPNIALLQSSLCAQAWAMPPTRLPNPLQHYGFDRQRIFFLTPVTRRPFPATLVPVLPAVVVSGADRQRRASVRIPHSVSSRRRDLIFTADDRRHEANKRINLSSSESPHFQLRWIQLTGALPIVGQLYNVVLPFHLGSVRGWYDDGQAQPRYLL